MNIISEEHYEESMRQIVLPYLENAKETGMFERVPGQKIVYEHYTAGQPSGVVVLVHGFSEVPCKFSEMIYYFLKRGMHVWAIHQRGHGGSFRDISDPSVVYIEDFKDLIRDLRFFVRKIVMASPQTGKLPLTLYGHSMGGGIGACYLEIYPDDFSAAILSSPMLKLNSGDIPAWAAASYARLMIAIGNGKQPMPGSQPFPDKPDFASGCTTCEARYLWWYNIQHEHPEYQMCQPSVQTAYQFLQITKLASIRKYALRVKARVLLLQAGKDTMVLPEGQNAFIRNIGALGTLISFPEAEHEIYREYDEVLQQYWDIISSFLP